MVRIILHAKFIVDLVIQHSYGNLSICKLCLMKKTVPSRNIRRNEYVQHSCA